MRDFLVLLVHLIVRRRRPGPKGPVKELIDAVVAMKRRNPSWGCPRIAQQIALAFGVEIDRDGRASTLWALQRTDDRLHFS